MEGKDPVPKERTVKHRCPQCYCFTTAKYHPNGTLTGSCNNCKAVFVCRRKDRETTIKIIAPQQ